MSKRWVWATAGMVAAFATYLLVFFPSVAHELKPAGMAQRDSVASLAVRQLPQAQATFRRAEFGSDDASAAISGPMIRRTASLKIAVKGFRASRDAMEAIVRKYGGYESDLTIHTPSGEAQSLTATLLVPSTSYEQALADLRALGQVEQEQQQGEEVSAQVIDLDARLGNAREEEARLGQILKRTGKMSEVLEVEQRLANVRGTIERMEGEQKQWHTRIAYTSIAIELSEEYRAALNAEPSGAWRQVRNAAVDGFQAAGEGLFALALFVIRILPSLTAFVLILFWPARWARRKWRRAQTQQP